jgi:predicted RNase H-like nuclease
LAGQLFGGLTPRDFAVTTLLVGFNSAWTAANFGAIVAVLHREDGTFRELGPPRSVNYGEAEATILQWQEEQRPTATVVLLDQPTMVNNAAGQRPVENLVSSPVSLR